MIDFDIRDADWTKRTWDLPEVDSLDTLLWHLDVHDEADEGAVAMALNHFLSLPVADAMPLKIRQEIVDRFDVSVESPVSKHGEGDDTLPERMVTGHKPRGVGNKKVRQRPTARIVAQGKRQQRVSGGFSTNFVHPKTGEEMKQTEVGQTYERLFAVKAAKWLQKELEVKGYKQVTSEGEGANTPADVMVGPAVRGKVHYFGEVKSLNINSEAKVTIHGDGTGLKKGPDGKLRPNPEDQLKRKIDGAAKTMARPLTIAQVVDQDKRLVRVYYSTSFVRMRTRKGDLRDKEGNRSTKAEAFREPAFTYRYSEQEFVNAQIDAGHWNPDKNAPTTTEEKKKLNRERKKLRKSDDEPAEGEVFMQVDDDGDLIFGIQGKDINGIVAREDAYLAKVEEVEKDPLKAMRLDLESKGKLPRR